MHSGVRMALNVGQIVGAFDVLRDTVVIRRETHEGLFLSDLPLVSTGLIQRCILQITIYVADDIGHSVIHASFI